MTVQGPAARRALAGASVLLATAGLAACGGDDAGPGSSGAAARELKFELTDQGCSPTAASVPAGPVRIEVSNPGTTKTDEVELKNADGIIMGERENLAPGLSADFTLTPPAGPVRAELHVPERAARQRQAHGHRAAAAPGTHGRRPRARRGGRGLPGLRRAQTPRARRRRRSVHRRAAGGRPQKAKDALRPRALPLRGDRADRRELRRSRPRDRRARQRRRRPVEVDGLPPHRADPVARRHDEGDRDVRRQAAGRRQRARTPGSGR